MSTGIYLPFEIETVDMRDDYIPRMELAIDRVIEYRKLYPNIKYVIISRTQRETLVMNTPGMHEEAEKMSRQFGKPIIDLDFQMVIENCQVVVE